MPKINRRNGALERTRTSDLQVRNLLLYPLSYERAGMEVYRSILRFRPSDFHVVMLRRVDAPGPLPKLVWNLAFKPTNESYERRIVRIDGRPVLRYFERFAKSVETIQCTHQHHSSLEKPGVAQYGALECVVGLFEASGMPMAVTELSVEPRTRRMSLERLLGLRQGILPALTLDKSLDMAYFW